MVLLGRVVAADGGVGVWGGGGGNLFRDLMAFLTNLTFGDTAWSCESLADVLDILEAMHGHVHVSTNSSLINRQTNGAGLIPSHICHTTVSRHRLRWPDWPKRFEPSYSPLDAGDAEPLKRMPGFSQIPHESW